MTDSEVQRHGSASGDRGSDSKCRDHKDIGALTGCSNRASSASSNHDCLEVAAGIHIEQRGHGSITLVQSLQDNNNSVCCCTTSSCSCSLGAMSKAQSMLHTLCCCAWHVCAAETASGLFHVDSAKCLHRFLFCRIFWCRPRGTLAVAMGNDIVRRPACSCT